MGKQSIEEIEASYNTPDPWQYKNNPDDLNRRARLHSVAKQFGPYRRVLDIGAGEGWITEGYPGIECIHGYEVSNQAAERFPKNVIHVPTPFGKYDLVACTGIFYGHYNWEFFFQMVKNHACKHVLVSSVEPWELSIVDAIGKEIHREVFKYRDWNQRLRLFQV